MKRQNYLTAFTALLIAGFFLAAFQTQKINITGKWNLVVETSAGSGNPVFTLKQENDTLITGTYAGLFGETALKGTIKGDKINITVPTELVTMQYIGTLENETIKGKVIYSVSDIGEGTFTGERAKD